MPPCHFSSLTEILDSIKLLENCLTFEGVQWRKIIQWCFANTLFLFHPCRMRVTIFITTDIKCFYFAWTKSRKSYCTTSGVGGGVRVSKKFNFKVFYVMGKALSGKLSCPCYRSCYIKRFYLILISPISCLWCRLGHTILKVFKTVKTYSSEIL